MSAETDKNLFLNNVCQRREKMGISVAELARRSGVPPAILEKLEQGVLPTEMMAHHTWMLAEAFGCEISELFE